MKIGQLLQPNLVSKLAELAKCPVEVKTAMKLATILETIQSVELNFESKRMELLKKYGKLDKKGNLKVSKDKTKYLMADQKGFQKEFKQLVDQEVEIPKLSLSDLEELKISAENLLILKPLLMED